MVVIIQQAPLAVEDIYRSEMHKQAPKSGKDLGHGLSS